MYLITSYTLSVDANSIGHFDCEWRKQRCSQRTQLAPPSVCVYEVYTRGWPITWSPQTLLLSKAFFFFCFWFVDYQIQVYLYSSANFAVFSIITQKWKWIHNVSPFLAIEPLQSFVLPQNVALFFVFTRIFLCWHWFSCAFKITIPVILKQRSSGQLLSFSAPQINILPLLSLFFVRASYFLNCKSFFWIC